MKILAIETSNKTADIAILDSELDRVWEKELKTVQKVSEVLVNEIKELLESVRNADLSSLRINDIDLISVGIGPGSYTGTRVGISTAKGLAQGLDVPIIGINSFEALIEAVDQDYENMQIIPLINAKNNRAYFQIKEKQGCEDIDEIIKMLEDQKYVFVGTGAKILQREIKRKFGDQAIIADREKVKAKVIARIAHTRAEANLYDNIFGLKPLYINKPNIGKSK